MGKKKDISGVTHGKISAYHEQGFSNREIAAKLGIHHKTVSNSLNKFAVSGFFDRKKGSGRKPILNNRQRRSLKALAKDNRKVSCRKLTALFCERFGAQVSKSTVVSTLSDFGIKKRKPLRKPGLTAAQVKKRREFWETYRHFTAANWGHVIFSDEKKFKLYGNDSCLKFWIGDDEKLNPDCVSRTEKYSVSVMVWGCFTSKGVGRLHLCEGSVNSDAYINILNTRLLPSASDYFSGANLDYWLFQDDNAPCHRSSTVKRWLVQNGVQSIFWPPNSPDLNPIENLWGLMIRQLGQKSFTTKQELIAGILNIWNHSISAETCSKLIDSMPERLEKLRLARFCHTKY